MADEDTKNDESEPEVTEEQEPEEQSPPDHHEEHYHKQGNSRWYRFLAWYKADKKKSIPLTIVVLLILIGLVPFTRYHVLGLALKKDFTLQVKDSTASTPVSGATVSLGSNNATTDGNGKVTLHHVAVGQHTFLITKKYYQDRRISVVVPILSQKNTPSVSFVATGRQVKIVVTNLINKQKVEGAEIKVSDISAKTDKDGTATIVVPAGSKSEKATLSAKNYNDANVTVQIANDNIKENDFNITPAGKVYFLSKLSGKIDVVKTNLDGTNRQTVLPGTGKEDDHGTVLLASRDWKYLALFSQRDGGNPLLYLIDTTNNDSLSTMDEAGNSLYTPVGWSDHYFVYTVNRQVVPLWQSGAYGIKSFNAEAKQTAMIDQTKATGTNSSDYAHETYGSVYEIGKTIVYEKTWVSDYYNQAALNDKQAGIYSIGANGSGFQTLKNFGYAVGGNTFINSISYEADQVYYQISEKGSPIFYLDYQDGKIKSQNDLGGKFNDYYTSSQITYLLSPGGNNTFWAEARDGKNTLFIGDSSGENGKQIATLSDYTNYGWYTDDYLFVSKNGSELYIVSKDGIKKDSDAIKISDYHKPTQNFRGYGGGYGGV